ncbi:hypothetical protein BANRA_02576 [Acinetobacter baumannii]|nr:hypothetical protein BANRA_02576 [Acinetobacter baumannii]
MFCVLGTKVVIPLTFFSYESFFNIFEFPSLVYFGP